MNKNKYLFFLFSFAALFLVSCGAALALEQPLPGLSGSATLPQYVKYLFGFIVGLAGVIASVSFAVGAVGLILASVSANAEGAKNAKDRMLGAILGLVLTGSSWVILNTINPTLLKPTLSPLPSVSLAPLPTPPGIYFYTETGCGGDASGPWQPSSVNMETKFAGKIKSVEAVGDTKSYYAIIFHQQPQGEFGRCNDQIVLAAGACPAINPVNTGSVDIVRMRTSFGALNDGITFYSEPNGYDSGQLTREGKLFLPDGILASTFLGKADEMKYDWTGATDLSADYKKTHETFQSSPGSIQVQGHYLTALYSEDPKDKTKLFCQTFLANVPNLKAMPIRVSGGVIKNVFIVPW